MTCNLYTIRLKMVRSMIEPLITIYLFILDYKFFFRDLILIIIYLLFLPYYIIFLTQNRSFKLSFKFSYNYLRQILFILEFLDFIIFLILF